MIRVVEAASDADVDVALELAGRVWGSEPLDLPVRRAQALAGWYCSLAYDGETPVGMCAGFVGLHGPDPHLHSHLAAVDPAAQGRGVGRVLKWHQHDWCADRDISTVTWTFDPLIGENARFNLHHLGATVAGYLVDLYGPVDDAINAGQPTDRLLVEWPIGSERVLAARSGATAGPAEAPATTVAAVTVGDDGMPHPVDSIGSVDACRSVALPDDIVALRTRDPDRALAWRLAVRRVLADDVAHVRGITADGQYLLGPR